MKKHAIIGANQIVENIVLWDGVSEWAPPKDKILIDVENIRCGIGWNYENGMFIEPPRPPVIEEKI